MPQHLMTMHSCHGDIHDTSENRLATNAMGAYLLVAAAGVLGILLGLCQAPVVLLSLAGGQLRRIGMLGCLMRLAVGVAPCILLSLHH